MTSVLAVFLVVTCCALAGAIIAMAMKAYRTPHITHYEFTDRDIILLISDQPDGVCDAELLAKNSTLTKKEAKARLAALSHRGMLTTGYSDSFKYYYSLKEKVAKGPYPKLSEHPFLSVKDLMLLFHHFDYRLTIQDICLATNLPVAVIGEEMKYFLKEKIVDQVTQTAPDGMSSSGKFYILKDPYRNDPKAIAQKEEALDLNVSKMYERMVAGKNTDQ